MGGRRGKGNQPGNSKPGDLPGNTPRSSNANSGNREKELKGILLEHEDIDDTSHSYVRHGRRTAQPAERQSRGTGGNITAEHAHQSGYQGQGSESARFSHHESFQSQTECFEINENPTGHDALLDDADLDGSDSEALPLRECDHCGRSGIDEAGISYYSLTRPNTSGRANIAPSRGELDDRSPQPYGPMQAREGQFASRPQSMVSQTEDRNFQRQMQGCQPTFPDERFPVSSTDKHKGRKDYRQPIAYMETAAEAADRYRSERNALKDKLDAKEQELKRTQSQLSSIHDAKLASVDRFAPKSDGDISNDFRALETKVKALANRLADPKLVKIAWADVKDKMIRSAWPHAYSASAKRLDPSQDGYFRKLVWRLVIWRWIDDTMIKVPFYAFDGDIAYSMQAVYERLFPNPQRFEDYDGPCNHSNDEESAKWRSTSIAFLIKDQEKKRTKTGSKEDEQSWDARANALQRLHDLLLELGISVVNPENAKNLEKKKIDPLVDTALTFARTIAAQRAVYQIYVPSIQQDNMKKMDDPNFTSVDEEFRTDDHENEGSIHYVGKPGLLRCGNPMGQNLGYESVVLTKAFAMLKT